MRVLPSAAKQARIDASLTAPSAFQLVPLLVEIAPGAVAWCRRPVIAMPSSAIASASVTLSTSPAGDGEVDQARHQCAHRTHRRSGVFVDGGQRRAAAGVEYRRGVRANMMPALSSEVSTGGQVGGRRADALAGGDGGGQRDIERRLARCRR